jgi:hypothetical protein
MNQQAADEIDRVNRQFNYDIREKNRELSRLDKYLFNLSINLSLSEMRIIRNSKINGRTYWDEIKGETIETRRKLLINRVSCFLQNIDNQCLKNNPL